MKKIIIFLTLIGTSLSQVFSNETKLQEEKTEEATIHSSYTYSTIGIGPLPIPAFTIGVGNRSIIGDNKAIDFGLSLATLIQINAIRGYVNILRYSKQTQKSQFYIGLGGSVGGIFGFSRHVDCGYVAPNFIVGKEFLNSDGAKRFFQVEVMYPLISITHHGVVNFPLFTLKYGFSF